MLCIDLSPTYYAPVRVNLLDADGALHEHLFDVLFERWTTQQITHYVESGTAQTALDFARAQVRGWRGVKNAVGAEVPFSEAALDRLLAIPNVAQAIAEAFYASWRPKEGASLAAKAAQKN